MRSVCWKCGTQGMTLRKVAMWMEFALEWMGYYRKRKHNQYH